jgi:hypothetical protein
MRARDRLSASERADLLRAPTLTLPEAAQVLGVGLSALRDAVRRAEVDLRVISIGRRKVIPTSAVLSFLDAQERSAVEA